MIAGGIAGCVGKSITAPLSRLTVLYQVAPLLQNNHQTTVRGHESITSAFLRIIRQEGWRSLWKGNGTAVLHRFPYSAVNFATFAMCSEHLSFAYPSADGSTIRLASGAVAGAVSCVACYPLDIIRTRLTVGIPSPHSHAPLHIRSVLIDILQREGFRGLFSGLPASLAVAVPTYALSFGVYGGMKELLLHHGGIFSKPAQKDHLSIVGSLLSGSITGVVSAGLMFPLDVVRKRCQVAGIITSSSSSTSIIHNIRNIYLADGLRGFYRGISAEILKVVPMVAVTFCAYEVCKDLLDRLLPDTHLEEMVTAVLPVAHNHKEELAAVTICSAVAEKRRKS